MATKAKVAEIVQRVDAIKSDDIKLAIEKTEIPGLPAFETRQHMSAIQRTLELIPQTELLFLPDENAQKLSNAVHSLGLAIAQLANFTLQGDRPSENLNAHRSQLLGAFGDVADNFYPYLPLIKPEYNEARLQKEVEGVSRLSAQVSQAYDEAKNVLDAMRAAAATTGASAHTSDFNREAQDHQKSANRWLLATWIAFVITAGAAYKLIGMAPGGEKLEVARHR
jgi:hypothetical protein